MLIRFLDFELDEEQFILRRSAVPILLRPKVFDLLVHLVRDRARVVPREELIRKIWGSTIVGMGSLSGLVNELRRGLGESRGRASSIRTVHARGYQFVADVVEEGAGPEVARAIVGRVAGLDRPADGPIVLAETPLTRQTLRSSLDAVGLGAVPESLVDELLRYHRGPRGRAESVAAGTSEHVGKTLPRDPRRRMLSVRTRHESRPADAREESS
jgi:DNA-binding winged helix-turn-helix (wHTH) protein